LSCFCFMFFSRSSFSFRIKAYVKWSFVWWYSCRVCCISFHLRYWFLCSLCCMTFSWSVLIILSGNSVTEIKIH
jgi:hypothetical protein